MCGIVVLPHPCRLSNPPRMLSTVASQEGPPGMAIILQESLRALFYAPFYVALARKAFAVEGVETYQKRPDCDIVCFAEVVTRDPFLLMGREPRPDFTLADLKSARLATVSEVPTPWLCLQHDLRLAGIDPTSIARIADQTMPGNVAALKAGEVDVIQVSEPFPSLLLAEGAAHVWYEAARRGPTSYTTFYARRGLLTTRRDELRRMTRAIHRTEKWVAKASGREIARMISAYFGDMAPAILEAACTRYKALGIWGDTPVLPRAGYDRLRDSLVSGGFVSPGATFATAVDNTLAIAVVAEQ